MKDTHLLDIQQVLHQLKSTPAGLSHDEADARRLEFGKNELTAKKQKSWLEVFLRQFKDLMIGLLAFAAVISFISGEHVDAWVIISIILGNALIGFVQEYNTETSIRKLQQMATHKALVLRDGSHLQIEAAMLVPGDIILLEAGNVVPADARLIDVNGLKAEEAALTGESTSVDKIIAPLPKDAVTPADQVNMVFKGTSISNGTGTAVVIATGMATELGKIAGMLGGSSSLTPLQKRLATFGRQIAIIVLVICVIIFGLGLLKGEPMLKMFLTAMSLAVAALPEALPVLVTVALARGASRMVRQNALVRRLTAVETLGSVGYICTDKTGTLTQNIMSVEHIQFEEGRKDLLLQAMMLNHEVKTNAEGVLLGDPTETALIRYATEQGLHPAAIEKELPTIGKIPFDSERMLMTTIHQKGDKWIVLVKGAPVKILEKLHSRHDTSKEQWSVKNREWATHGYRVLFFAYKELKVMPDVHDKNFLEGGLDFLGMAAIIDPPRLEVIDAIQSCHEAGIETVMITGDQPLTAKAIAERLHIIRHSGEKVVTGADILSMSAEQFGEQVKDIRVYARVSPEQKLNIVKALQRTGHSVAMTGDGVNDAPALKQADIGVAMGITGSDVSKETAHMILLDDNFTTIVKAIKEGRRIYDNIRKFIQYILSGNLGELLTILIAPLLGLPIPLLPIHILWINLVTDGLPGLALAAEPAEHGIMKKPPRSVKENLFAGNMIRSIITTGVIIAAGALLTQYLAIKTGYDTTAQQTMVFCVMCFTQMGNILAVRVGKHFILNRFFSNPFLLGAVGLTVLLQVALVYIPLLNNIFKTGSLNLKPMLLVLAVSVGCIVVIELVKLAEIRWSKSVLSDGKLD